MFRFASKEVSLMPVFLCGEKLGVGGCWFMKSNKKILRYGICLKMLRDSFNLPLHLV